MPLAKSGHEPGPTPTPAPASRQRPSVEEILARYIQAIGGTNASSTKTLFMKGTRVALQNRSGPTEVTLALPDKLLIVQGPTRQILNGDNGWVLNGNSLQTLAAIGDARRNLEAVFGVVKVRHSAGMQLVRSSGTWPLMIQSSRSRLCRSK
jgi:hypothetical protein